MLFKQLFNLIDESSIGRLIDKKMDVIERTDPERIYIENIREFYGLPYSVARYLCELAVKRGIFRKKIGIICPNDKRIIKSFDFEPDLDEEIDCTACQIRETVNYTFKINKLNKVVYYQLKE